MGRPLIAGMVEVEEGTAGGCGVALTAAVAEPACSIRFLNPDCSATALACTTKIPIEPGIPIPSNNRIAKKEWRFLARMTPTCLRAGLSPFSRLVTAQLAGWLYERRRSCDKPSFRG